MSNIDGFNAGRKAQDPELSRLAEALVSTLRQIRELEREVSGDIPADEQARTDADLVRVVSQSCEVATSLGEAMDRAGTIGVLTHDSLLVRKDDPDVMVSGPDEVAQTRNENSPEFIVFPRARLGL